MIKGAIFDMDGTLLDTMPLWDNAGAMYLETLGVAAKPDLGKVLYPMTFPQAAAYLKKEYATIDVLELGPGSGLALRMFSENHFSSTAIDISGKIIEVAKRNSPNSNFIKANFLEHDFGDTTFSGIFAKAFIHLFPKNDAIAVLDKIYKLTAPRGCFFIATSIHNEPSEGYEEKSDYADSPIRFRKKWTEDELMLAVRDKWTILDKNYNQERGKSWLALTLSKKSD